MKLPKANLQIDILSNTEAVKLNVFGYVHSYSNSLRTPNLVIGNF